MAIAAATGGQPSIPDAGHAYLGAFADPTGYGYSPGKPRKGTSSAPTELAATSTLNQSLSKPLSIVQVQLRFYDPNAVVGMARAAHLSPCASSSRSRERSARS